MTYPDAEAVRGLVQSLGGEHRNGIARAALRLGLTWFETSELYRDGRVRAATAAFWQMVRRASDAA